MENAKYDETNLDPTKFKDGDVVTACQQACPTNAILFGNRADLTGAVGKAQKQSQSYLLLEELNTRPRTTYLAHIRNPNPALETATEE